MRVAVLPMEGLWLRPTLPLGLRKSGSQSRDRPGSGAQSIGREREKEQEGRRSWQGPHQWCSTSLIK